MIFFSMIYLLGLIRELRTAGVGDAGKYQALG
jgi:hypothetical protein